ncbi:MAG TPA: ATPase domain-containing protein [Nitrososphaerales archaeon]|nr:ATPase domain-containing protein [Nitrososphaerales archaeon]
MAVAPGEDIKHQSGLPGLDSMLDGGFNRGRVILVLGEPGTGKTIVCSQFLHHGAAVMGENSMFIGMNEPKTRFLKEMLALGMDFAKLEGEGKFKYVDATEVRKIPEQTKVGRIAVGGRELGLVNLLETIQDAMAKFEPSRIAVDSMSDLVFRFPTVEERRPVVLDLIETLQSSSATSLLTSELLSTGEERLLQPEEYLAEGVLLLRTLRKGVRTVQILKMRGSKVDTHPRPYVITGRGLEVLATEEVY